MSASAYPEALPPQFRLHWYVLERVLGQGGFGITYLARDTNLDQPVAIKEFLPVEVATRRSDATVRPRSDEQAERYRGGLERFIREARILARFDHPNIVRVHSVFEQNGTAYMVMRFEEGENFAAMLERKRTLAEAELMRVLLPVLDGLELVHNAGFIHRDIKPDNIHIRADGSPVLLDFGSARHALGQARTVTILVAPGYAPFEQYYSSGEDQGPWTDIYGLGATCYRAIAGVPPMDAIARSKGILGSTRELLVPAAAMGSGRYAPQLLQAIDHALAFAEKDRPATIALWRRELPAGAAVAPAPGRQPAARRSAPPASAPIESAASSAPPRMSPLSIVASAVLAAALIGGGVGAYTLLRGPGPQPVTPAAAPEPRKPAADAAQLEAEAERLARRKAEEERAAREKAEREELDRRRAEEQRLAAEKAEKERLAAMRAGEEQRLARARAESEKKLARQRSEQERLARLKAEEQRSAEERAAVEQQARLRAEEAAPKPEAAPKGDAAAFTFYRGLALRGDADAALKLGEMYETGRGTAPSNNWAYTWYAVAEQRGAAEAKGRKDAVAKRLQPKEIEQGDRVSRSLAGPAR